MTAHELAKRLLEGPDLIVFVSFVLEETWGEYVEHEVALTLEKVEDDIDGGVTISAGRVDLHSITG